MAESERFTVMVVSEERELTLGEVCRGCDLAADQLLEMVGEGLLQPEGGDPRQWRFSAVDVQRVHSALRLQHDLGLNLPGATLALDLLDEMQRLRTRVRLLEQMLR